MDTNIHREKILKYILCVTGVFGILISLYLSYGVYFHEWDNPFHHTSYKNYILILCSTYVFVNYITGINKSFFNRRLYKEITITIELIAFMVTALVVLLFWLHKIFDSHRMVIGYFTMFFLVIETIVRVSVKSLLKVIFHQSKFARRMLVITDKHFASKVITSLVKTLDWTRQITGVCILDADDSYKLSQRVESAIGSNVVCNLNNLLEYATQNSVDEVFVFTNAVYSNEKFKKILSKIEEMGVRVNIKIKIDLFDCLPNSYTKIDQVGGFQCVSVSRNFYSGNKIAYKHILDYIGGFIGFIFFCLLYITLGPIIKLDSKGPILYSQPRVGKNGRIFKCYKFRSMVTNADALKAKLQKDNEMQGLMFKMENDPRITKVGKFIRKTSLDEFPQFINVLKGDMSLVGTRPPTVDEYESYNSKQKARVSMTTGLTGLWQISGRSEIKSFDDVIRLDMKYIDNWSIWLDLKIILLTVLVVVLRKGAK